jgi:arylsulfatase
MAHSMFYKDWWVYEFWRFVLVQEEVVKLATTAIDYPPMQPGASFDLSAVIKKIKAAKAGHAQ